VSDDARKHVDRQLTWGFSSSQVYPQGYHRGDEALVVTRYQTTEIAVEGDPHGARLTKKNYIEVAGKASFSDISV